MVKHVILWTLKEEHNTPAVKERMKTALEGLAGQIPGLVDIRVVIHGLPTSNADVMLDATFTDEAALAAYAIHPLHVEAADTCVRPFTATRSCLDFAVFSGE